jgi:hypothetical protein
MLVPCLAYSLTLKMEAIYSSETSIDFQWAARHYSPKVGILQLPLCSGMLFWFRSQFSEILEIKTIEKKWPIIVIFEKRAKGWNQMRTKKYILIFALVTWRKPSTPESSWHAHKPCTFFSEHCSVFPQGEQRKLCIVILEVLTAMILNNADQLS